MPTVEQTIQKVRGFSNLPEGWHFNEGVPPTLERVERAIRFLAYAELNRLSRANAFPGTSGQIEVTFYLDTRMLEITLEADDSITIAEDVGDEQFYFEENLFTYDAYRKIEEFSQEIWLSSDLFIGSTMILSAVGSRVPPLISEAESPFPLWTATVLEAIAEPIVYTSHGTIESKQEYLLYTGQFPTVTFQADVPMSSRQHLTETSATKTFPDGAGTIFGACLPN
jgi:hypothetical protein